jgi:hypothetical protein
MDEVTVDQVLEKIRRHLHLSKETEHELLEEIRTHLEDTAAEAAARGEDPYRALLLAAERFGVEAVAAELQDLHAGRESLEALAAAALPVLFAVVMRWLAFAPDGSSVNWQQMLERPGFWIVAFAALLIPGMLFQRWRFALAGWGIFWLLTVLFTVFPTNIQW